MKHHRLQLVALVAAVVSLLAYGAVPAFATAGPPNAPTAVHAYGLDGAAALSWPAATVPVTSPVSGPVTGYTVTPTPACGGCTGLTTTGANSTATKVVGLTNSTAYTFTVHATNVQGNSVESAASNSVTPEVDNTSGCTFSSFPAVPNSSSELAVACTLSTAIGGAGNNYKVEDLPQVTWHQGAGRTITTTASTASTSAVITGGAAARFSTQDINNTISGPGIPSNTFIKAIGAGAPPTTVTLNKAVGSPGVATGAKLIIDNSDGRTITDAGPRTTVAAGSNGQNVSSLTGNKLLVASVANFTVASGTIQVATSAAGGATLNYTGVTTTTGSQSFNNITVASGSGTVTGPVGSTPGKAVNAVGVTKITSATAHFCGPAVATGCGSGATLKNDTGRTIEGTIFPHSTTISSVVNGTTIMISNPTIACSLVGTLNAANCNQMGISAPPTLSTARQIQDATFPTLTHLCSLTANFVQTDVNLAIASVGAAKIPAGDYITAVNNTGCAVGATGVNLKVAANSTPANASVVIGARNATAPVNGDAIMALASELSVLPSLAAGVPDCTANTAVGSNLVGKWLNPGSFDVSGLGSLPNTGVKGAVIAQLDVNTGPGNPAFAGYVVIAKASTPGDTQTAAHYDLVFPSLLTGTAVCPVPNTVGVATIFRFFGSTLSQSVAGSGDVRSFKDIVGNGSAPGTAYEHIILNPNAEIFAANGSCTVTYPTTSAGYPCGGD